VWVLGGDVGAEAGTPKILPWHAVIFSDYFDRAVDQWGTIIC
jgi:hypothetical protein